MFTITMGAFRKDIPILMWLLFLLRILDSTQGIVVVDKIPEGLQTGKSVRIKGTIPKWATTFNISLQKDSEYLVGPVGCHIAMKIKENSTVLDTFRANVWQNPITKLQPLKAGQQFQMMIFPDKEKYKIYVDGLHLWDLPYRMPIQDLTHLLIVGDVWITLISWEDKTSFELSEEMKIVSIESIPKGFKKEGMLKIQGSVPQNAKRFSINLQKRSKLYDGDVGLHLAMRFDEKAAILNSFRGRKWESEVIRRLRIKAGQEQFKISIVADVNHFKISINGWHFHDFPYRTDINDLTHLLIQGDVLISSISWEDSDKWNTKWIQEIPSGELKKGQKVRVQGTIPKNAKRFHVNLQKGRKFLYGDIGLHFAVRFDENRMLANSYQNDTFKEEKRFAGFPFKAEQEFELTILADTNNYKIAVNDQNFYEFAYRISPYKITHLSIDGDILADTVSWKYIDLDYSRNGCQQRIVDVKSRALVDENIPI